MSRIKTDPLLMAAKGLLYFFIVVFIFSMVMVGIGIGGVLSVGHAQLTQMLIEASAPPVAFWAIIAVLALTMLLLGLIVNFCMKLLEVVKSVDQGDPFHPDNARRLAHMGWLSLGAWAVTIPLGAMAMWLSQYADEAGDVQVELDGSIDGLILALILFILARVFRHGAAMREDLEGTV